MVIGLWVAKVEMRSRKKWVRRGRRRRKRRSQLLFTESLEVISTYTY